MRELSWIAIILGVVIGAALAAANAYVGLKVGMTVSASIPAAVVSMLVLRVLLKRGTILENNIVQTIGSAGESLAAGMIFTIPALYIMGQDPDYLSMVIWGSIGGLLGVAFMVPLRRVLIVKEHGVLPFPEGVACAEVLESGERGGSSAVAVIWGAVVGGVYQLLSGTGFWPETAHTPIPKMRTQFALDSSPALLGVGYILGLRVAGFMMAGAVLAWFVLIPGIGVFGASAAEPVPPGTGAISAMDPAVVHRTYIRYIGAGAVAIAGLISLGKSFPTIVSSLWHVAVGIVGGGRRTGDRTDRDVPFALLLLIILGLGFAMWQFPQIKVNHTGAIAVLVFSFLFVTVSSRLVGIVGSSSNPVSGMTIASLLGTALVFKYFVSGEGTDPTALKIGCLSVGALVCTAICIAGDTSQDLKTGFLVKATPWKQQLGEVIGVLTSVVLIAWVIQLMSRQGFSADEAHPHAFAAPQANIMKTVVEGVVDGNLPWTLIIIGGAIAVMVELLGLPALPFAVGFYLPLGLTTPIMVGGIIRWLIDRRRRESTEHDPGVLTASGLVAGTGLMGVGIIAVGALIAAVWDNPRWHSPLAEPHPPYVKVLPGEVLPDGTTAPERHELVGDAVDEAGLPRWQTEDVMPVHFVPWLWSKLGDAWIRWGMTDRWWESVSYIPFALMALWLLLMARRRPPVMLAPTPGVTTPTPASGAPAVPPAGHGLLEEPGTPGTPPEPPRGT